MSSTPPIPDPARRDARRDAARRAELAARWASLARAVGLDPRASVVVALSGGADSVLLLHLVAAAAAEDAPLAARRGAPPRVSAVHVEHGLRGAEGDLDAAFCAELAASLGVRFVSRRVELDPAAPSLEARAREARYRALCDEAARLGVATILTGHHSDDALETLLQRWLRGTELAGLAGLRPRLALSSTPAPRAAARERLNASGSDVEVVRPLIAMRREEVRRILSEHGLAWREDGSNASARFTRNRVRHALLPAIEEACGPAAIENLRAFTAAVETLEERCAERTAGLAWHAPLYAAACRGADEADLGGTLERARLAELVRPLRRRALWRLIAEGTGHAPTRATLDRLLDDLDQGLCARRNLAGGWSLQLRSRLVHLDPPPPARGDARRAPGGRQLDLFAADAGGPPGADRARDAVALALPGLVTLADGRSLSAEPVEVPRSTDVLRSPHSVEVDGRDLGPLAVRFPRPGDRFRGLGAPGTKPLARFLADAGVPRRDRERVPLVVCGDEIVWVAGIRPAESHRVRSTTDLRVRLALHHPAIARATFALPVCARSTRAAPGHLPLP